MPVNVVIVDLEDKKKELALLEVRIAEATIKGEQFRTADEKYKAEDLELKKIQLQRKIADIEKANAVVNAMPKEESQFYPLVRMYERLKGERQDRREELNKAEVQVLYAKYPSTRWHSPVTESMDIRKARENDARNDYDNIDKLINKATTPPPSAAKLNFAEAEIKQFKEVQEARDNVREKIELAKNDLKWLKLEKNSQRYEEKIQKQIEIKNLEKDHDFYNEIMKSAADNQKVGVAENSDIANRAAMYQEVLALRNETRMELNDSERAHKRALAFNFDVEAYREIGITDSHITALRARRVEDYGRDYNNLNELLESVKSPANPQDGKTPKQRLEEVREDVIQFKKAVEIRDKVRNNYENAITDSYRRGRREREREKENDGLKVGSLKDERDLYNKLLDSSIKPGHQPRNLPSALYALRDDEKLGILDVRDSLRENLLKIKNKESEEYKTKLKEYQGVTEKINNLAGDDVVGLNGLKEELKDLKAKYEEREKLNEVKVEAEKKFNKYSASYLGKAVAIDLEKAPFREEIKELYKKRDAEKEGSEEFMRLSVQIRKLQDKISKLDERLNKKNEKLENLKQDFTSKDNALKAMNAEIQKIAGVPADPILAAAAVSDSPAPVAAPGPVQPAVAAVAPAALAVDAAPIVPTVAAASATPAPEAPSAAAVAPASSPAAAPVVAEAAVAAPVSSPAAATTGSPAAPAGVASAAVPTAPSGSPGPAAAEPQTPNAAQNRPVVMYTSDKEGRLAIDFPDGAAKMAFKKSFIKSLMAEGQDPTQVFQNVDHPSKIFINPSKGEKLFGTIQKSDGKLAIDGVSSNLGREFLKALGVTDKDVGIDNNGVIYTQLGTVPDPNGEKNIKGTVADYVLSPAAVAPAPAPAAPLTLTVNTPKPEQAQEQTPDKPDAAEPSAAKPATVKIPADKKINQGILQTITKILKEKGIDVTTDLKTGVTTFSPGKNQRFEDFINTTLQTTLAAEGNLKKGEFGMELEFPKNISLKEAAKMLGDIKPPENREMLGKIFIEGKEYYLDGPGFDNVKVGPRPVAAAEEGIKIRKSAQPASATPEPLAADAPPAPEVPKPLVVAVTPPTPAPETSEQLVVGVAPKAAPAIETPVPATPEPLAVAVAPVVTPPLAPAPPSPPTQGPVVPPAPVPGTTTPASEEEPLGVSVAAPEKMEQERGRANLEENPFESLAESNQPSLVQPVPQIPAEQLQTFQPITYPSLVQPIPHVPELPSFQPITLPAQLIPAASLVHQQLQELALTVSPQNLPNGSEHAALNRNDGLSIPGFDASRRALNATPIASLTPEPEPAPQTPEQDQEQAAESGSGMRPGRSRSR